MEDKIYLRNTDLEDREKRNRIFNPETGISEDGTMHDCVYRPWINQPKKEQTMTREEAIERLKNIRSVPSIFIDEIIKELVEALQEPPTLADFLGWEEGQEYKWRGVKYRIFYDILQYFDEDERVWWDSIEELNDYLRLRQAKKVEKPKLKAYHVKDEYSYNCLMKELEEQGYMFMAKSYGATKPTRLSYNIAYGTRDYIYLLDGKDIGWSSEEHTRTPYEYEDKEYDLIEYHKEEPRYLLQTDLTSENGVQYLSFDKKRREYFMGALMTSENVQQKFTDSEISKIKSITRFAKLCEKIVLNDGIKI